MTEEQLKELWIEMRKQRIEARQLPYEPSPVEFGKKVAEIEYERGYNNGWDREEYSGLVGD